MKIQISEERFKEILKEEMDALKQEEAAPDMFGEPDEEGGMARGELFKIGKYAVELRKMLQNDDQLPAWVQSKITKCAAMMGDVKHFLEGQMADQSDEMAPEQEDDMGDEEVELGDDENLEEIIQSALEEVLVNEKKN